MYESFDDPPQQQPRGYSAFQYLLGAAAGCVIASFVAIGVVIWLATTGSVRDDAWRTVFEVLAAAPILGAVSGILVLASNHKAS